MQLEPAFGAFSQTYGTGHAQALVARLVADLETPVSAMLKLASERPMSFLLESVEGGRTRGRYSAMGFEPDLILQIENDTAAISHPGTDGLGDFVPCPGLPLDALRSQISACQLDLPEGVPPIAVGLFGYMGYEMVRQMERLPDPKPDAIGLPDAIFMRPTVTVVFDSVTGEVIVTAPVWPSSNLTARQAYDRAAARLTHVVQDLDRPMAHKNVRNDIPNDLPQPRSNMTLEDYCAMVETAKEYIHAGDIFQVVPSQRFSLPFPLPPFSLYRALRRLNPSPYLVYFDFGAFAVAGSSPEILVKLDGDTVTIRPIAGTAPRGQNREEDQTLAEALLADPKERAEHLMLLDLGRNDVGRVSEIGSVKVTEQFTIERYSHVMHIVSNVQGRLAKDHDAISALSGGFPAGTVSGAPKIRAMEIINELEPEKRGIYAGMMGYFACDGSMDNCIALRTGVVKDGQLFVQAGGGVVADSDPKAEFQESVNKASALLRAAEEAYRFASPVEDRAGKSLAGPGL